MRESRKMEHVRHALALGQSRSQGLEDVTFVHNCLPETAFNRISLNTRIGDLMMRSPILINAMTGGADETQRINHELALAAKECGIAIAVGSQMAAIKNKDVMASYTIVRKVNPQGIVFANIGGEASVEEAKQAVEMIEASALQIHLNVVQELVMPEGDRDFTGMLERIVRIKEELDVPVIIKEVGFGMSQSQAKTLKNAGFEIIDVGGYGGTNFATIENERRSYPLDWFNQWGMTTSNSIIECNQVYTPSEIIASGGITSPIEIAKALSLGASGVGLAGTVLKAWKDGGVKAIVHLIRDLEQNLMLIMTALGVERLEDLWTVPIVIQGSTLTWCQQRGIDTTIYARRTKQ